MADRIITAAFIAILILPSIAWFFASDGAKAEITENRALKEKPVLNIMTVKQFPADFNAYYSDHLPFRNDLIRVCSYIQYRTFGATDSERVLFGKDGWLFYKNRNDGDPLTTYKNAGSFTRKELETAAVNIMLLKNETEKSGGRFILFIAPSKEMIYPEYMPDWIKRGSGRSKTLQMISYLREKTGAEIIYPAESLRDSKKSGILYYKYDMHWNSLGGYEASKALLRATGRSLPEADRLQISLRRISGAEAKIGQGYDMAKLAGINRLLNEPYSWEISGYGEESEEKLQSEGYEDRFICKGQKGKLMLAGDSFREEMRKPLSSTFGESFFKLYHYFSPDDIEKEKPDIFVYEVLEVYSSRLFTEKNNFQRKHK